MKILWFHEIVTNGERNGDYKLTYLSLFTRYRGLDSMPTNLGIVGILERQ